MAKRRVFFKTDKKPFVRVNDGGTYTVYFTRITDIPSYRHGYAGWDNFEDAIHFANLIWHYHYAKR